MSWMFLNDTNFNKDIGDWDTSNVTDIYSMFLNATNFNGDYIINWDTLNVTDMNMMFYGVYNCNQDIGGWNIQMIINLIRILWRGYFKMYL